MSKFSVNLQKKDTIKEKKANTTPPHPPSLPGNTKEKIHIN